MNTKKLKYNFLLILLSGFVFFVFINHDEFFSTFFSIVKLFYPFIIGFVIAFLFNRPYEFFRTKVYVFNLENRPKISESLRKFFSIFSVYFLILGSIVVIFSFIIPQIINSIKIFGDNLNNYKEIFEQVYNRVSSFFNFNFNLSEGIFKLWSQISKQLSEIFEFIFPHVLNATINFTSLITNFILGIVVSVYILASKEKLLFILKKISYAIVPKKYIASFNDVMSYSNKTFSDYISGKLLDSLIVGILCFIGMVIFNIPFAALISTIVGITNIIPIFGPFIGTIPCAFIVFIFSPIKALWFVILILILQQFDANILGPRILGGCTGLSGIFVLFSIIIGGGLFGIVGMLIGVPAFSVIYYIFKNIFNRRLKSKFKDVDIVDSNSFRSIELGEI